jgi:hypothetical protein
MDRVGGIRVIKVGYFFTVAFPVTRPIESLKVTTFPETVLLPLILPDESRYVVEPEHDVDAVPLIRPWASLKVVDEPESDLSLGIPDRRAGLRG